jgi:hypothetical protein
MVSFQFILIKNLKRLGHIFQKSANIGKKCQWFVEIIFSYCHYRCYVLYLKKSKMHSNGMVTQDEQKWRIFTYDGG